jgi:hypothetical protein
MPRSFYRSHSLNSGYEVIIPMRIKAPLSILVLLYVIQLASAQVPSSDFDRKAMIRADMVAFNPNYRQLIAQRRPILELLAKRVYTQEAEGHKVTCSYEILTETRWLMGYTADFSRIDQDLTALKESLAHPEREALAEEEDPKDGSWGGCYTEWFERLDSSYDMLQMEKKRGIALKYRFSLLDRINSPEKLRAYFASITTSDVAHTGRDNRKELNFAYVDLIRLIDAGEPAGYYWNPKLKQILMDLTLNVYRNTNTGWWGETYIHNGKREYVDDLSITFHIVQSLGGDVPLKDRLATTLFAVTDADYPVGWMDHGVQSNHNNMDVIVLMRESWKSMSPAQRQRGTEEIRRMLHWCLTKSLQPDGSFRVSPGGDESIEEVQHFGVGFLARIGYFDKTKRFWTDEDFPAADANRHRILAFIEAHQNSGADGGAYYSSAITELNH